MTTNGSASEAQKRAAIRVLGAFLALSSLGACASYREYEPTVDMAGHTKANYDYTLLLCRENAKELDILRGAGLGVVVGTALGAGIGAVTGSALTGAAAGAGGGVMAGAAAGSLYGPANIALGNPDPHAGEIRRCLEARGYTLLDPAPATASPAPTAPAEAAPVPNG